MSSAIVRSCIANSSIEQMLTDRKHIREMMQKDMFNVVKNWGVWVETFEVTEVTISSSSLFRDLQTNYREKVRKDAEICKMNFSSELAEIRQKNNAKQTEFRRKIDEQRRIYEQKISLEISEEAEKYEAQNQQIQKERAQIQLEQNLFEAKLDQEREQKRQEINQQLTTARNKQQFGDAE